jgi:hypothetical protein
MARFACDGEFEFHRDLWLRPIMGIIGTLRTLALLTVLESQSNEAISSE